MALLALLNFCLVCFNLSYLEARDIYLQFTPRLVQLYDPVKGVQPHPETQYYLDQVDQLARQVSQTGLRSPETESLLENLQQLSLQIISDDPFAVAGKSRTLAKIEQEMRDRTRSALSQDALLTFWSPAYLAEAGWDEEIGFFETDLRPLINANFYRDVGRYGRFVDHFWQIDLPFMLIFAADFLIRTRYISRRRPDLSQWEAMLRRWYDLFLLLPFWRWLRIVPVTLRLYQTRLLSLEAVRSQINHDFAIGFAQELTEMIGVQVIDQIQDAIEQGEVTRWILHPESRQPYVQVNQTNESVALANRLIQVSVYDVLPHVQADIENLIHHVVISTLNQSPEYRQFQSIPGLGQIPSQAIERLAKGISQGAYQNLVNVLEDPVGAEITSRISRDFRDVLEAELKKSHNVEEIQSLLVDLLEEIKINYVKQIFQGGTERALEEVEQLNRRYRNSVK